MKSIFKIILLVFAFAFTFTSVTMAHDIGVNTKVSKIEVSKSLAIANYITPIVAIDIAMYSQIVANDYNLLMYKQDQYAFTSQRTKPVLIINDRLRFGWTDSYLINYTSFRCITPDNFLPVKLC